MTPAIIKARAYYASLTPAQRDKLGREYARRFEALFVDAYLTDGVDDAKLEQLSDLAFDHARQAMAGEQ